ncbi:tyrosine-type recombinase/integrase [Actinophytocola sp.]|uniref:tyrosine-type recombinase/integrase n=1 Tax=Actinophytocola sp. TaxID=1872138 RepID=UPI00389AFD14
MATSFKVRIWGIGVYEGKRKTTYQARWAVNGKAFKEYFATRKLADGFRSKLLTAAREGVAFDVESGLPVTMLQTKQTKTPWFDFACAYMDMKWPTSSPGHRKSTADALVPITVAMLRNPPTDKSEAEKLRKTLRQAFNVNTRPPTEETRWISRNSRAVNDLAKPDALRALLGSIDKKLDGKRAAQDTIRLRRITLGNALDFAVERKVLNENPLKEIKVSKVKTVVHEVDRRCVANPVQARTLLRAVDDVSRRLVAFFGLMYFAALRPEEAANLGKTNLAIPDEGWGEIFLQSAAPEIGAEWTDSGERSEARGLKHREAGTGRTVPCSPELTAILHRHLDTHGTAPDGRLFWGTRGGGRLPSSVYGRVWAKAREAAFTPEVVASPLAKRPYDLRHAAVSTWLNAGVEATRVAEWAGHSVAVLLRVYAKCLDGGEQAARAKVQQAMTG